MNKFYFINLNVSCKKGSFNKFIYSIVEVDLENEVVSEIAEKMVRGQFGCDPSDTIINVTAFNNID